MNRWSVLSALLLFSSLGTNATATEITLSGRYEYRTDEESLDIVGRQVCFFPSASSAGKVPRPASDKRISWFCFSNSETAARMLGFSLKAPAKACGIRGQAMVTVSDYILYTKEGDGNDVATLRTVVQQSAPETLPCLR